MYVVLATMILNKCKCALLFIHTHTHTSALSFSAQVFPEAESVWLTLDVALCENEWFSVTDMITTVLRSFCNSTCLFFSASHLLILKGLYSLLFINLVICHNRCCNNTWMLCLYNGELNNWTLLAGQTVVRFLLSLPQKFIHFMLETYFYVIKMYLRRSLQQLMCY